LHSELEALQVDMKKITGDVEGVADNRIHLALRKAEDVACKAYHLAEDAASHVVRDVDQWATGNLDTAHRSITTRPLSAVALSLGVGALLGVLFARR
jgi:ElaB/YqjD/DUF883 family membrane-anchored ribosome-binding protein